MHSFFFFLLLVIKFTFVVMMDAGADKWEIQECEAQGDDQ